MSTYKFDKTKLLEATGGGLDIILHYYPEADRKGSGKFPHFKTHGEATASSIILETDGFFMIKNFGGGDNLTPFDLVMQKEGLEFGDACKWIAATFGLEGQKTSFGHAEIRVEPATKGQKDGDYYFKYRNQLTELEKSTIGPLMDDKLALEFNLHSCDYFIQVKQYNNHKKYGNKLMQIITKSTEQYPILVFENEIKDKDGKPTGEKWQKIYQPLNVDKGYRFRYAGPKPKNYLFGLDLIEEYYEPLKSNINEHNKKQYEEEYGDNGENDPRADVIILAGGDRDC